MVGVAVRQDDEIEIGKVNALRLHIGGEDVAIVAGVERGFACRRPRRARRSPNPSSSRHRAEGVVEDRDLAVGLGRGHSGRATTAATPVSAAAKNNVARSFMEVPPLENTPRFSLPSAALGDFAIGLLRQARRCSDYIFDRCRNIASALTIRTVPAVIWESMLKALWPLIRAMHKYALIPEVSLRRSRSAA